MDFDLRYPDGLHPVYLWSLRGDQHWCSVGSSPDFVPPDVNEYVGSALAYPSRHNSQGLLSGLEHEGFPARYDPTLHWLSWNPVCRDLGTEDETMALIFGANPVTLREHYYDVQRSGGSDDRDSPMFAGYFLDKAWQTHILYISQMNSTLISLGRLNWGIFPSSSEKIRYPECTIMITKHARLLTMLVALFSVNWVLFPGIPVPKQGYTFALWWDYHELNVPHLLDHSIPFHYCWTKAESSSGRFVRYGPGFLTEYATLAMTQPIGPLDLCQLPHYLEWERDLNRYDVYFQDLFAGRRGGTIRDFRPEWEYLIVDFSHYGARPVENRFARRAYPERFKGVVKHLAKDHFGEESKVYGKSELEYYYEPTPCVQLGLLCHLLIVQKEERQPGNLDGPGLFAEKEPYLEFRRSSHSDGSNFDGSFEGGTQESQIVEKQLTKMKSAFELYIKQSDVRKVGMPSQVTSLIRSTLLATYTMGLTEIFLDFGAGGATCYARYLSQILALLSHPHAVAFIAAGGILSFIAQLYNKELVTEFSKGKTLWVHNGEEDECWTTDQVSEGEISVLLGHIVTGNPSTDTFLWPHPSWLESDSNHFHGAWTPAAFSFLKNLEQNIVQKKQYTWRTRKEWMRFIRTGNRGSFAADHIPTAEDFREGMDLIESAFPFDWEKKYLSDIVIPEKFEQFAPQD
ncbi:hypothetical protein B0H13DRAFT_1853080 [Mycena leptocephala]|nr:hypothetical protein B0H13DRAFT_1853080 [Mycena leptocephala]